MKIIPFLIFASLLFACGKLDEKKVDGFGLPIVQLEMNSENLGLLSGQTTSKRPVAGNVRMEGNISLKCEVSFAGQSSLNDYRKSFNFRSCKGDPEDRSRFRLAAQNRDQTTVRSIMGYEVFATLDGTVPSNEIVAAYINRDYIGVYLLSEPISTEFYERRGLGVNHIYQAKFGNSGFEKERASSLGQAFDYEGDGQDNFVPLSGLYSTLWDSKSDEEFTQRLNLQLDVDNFLSYMASALFIAHWDGFDNNYFLALDEHQNKMTITPWDLDRVWEKSDAYEPATLLAKNDLLARMLKVPAYESIFLTKLDTLRAAFPLDQLLAKVDAHHEKVQLALAKDPVNGANQERNFEDLRQKVILWHSKVEAYRGAFLRP